MTLFELQAWLGHRSLQFTQYYAKITPNTLSKAYSEAGYFERNVRTIEVLADRDAVASGAAAAGEAQAGQGQWPPDRAADGVSPQGAQAPQLHRPRPEGSFRQAPTLGGRDAHYVLHLDQ